MRPISPFSLTLLLAATAAAAGIEIARRFAASGREVSATRAMTSRLSERLVEHEQAARDDRHEVAHTIRNLEIKLGQAIRDVEREPILYQIKSALDLYGLSPRSSASNIPASESEAA